MPVHVTAMDFLMADRTVAEPRRAQVMKRRWDYTQRGLWSRRCSLDRQPRMTLQADKTHLLPRQHARIRRSMLLVTASAALHAHGRVLESEWAALVAVAFETAGFVGCEQVHHARAKGAVRIVTIRAGHSSF